MIFVLPQIQSTFKYNVKPSLVQLRSNQMLALSGSRYFFNEVLLNYWLIHCGQDAKYLNALGKQTPATVSLFSQTY